MNKDFLSGLMDFTFTEFVTTRIVKFVYILHLVLAGLFCISMLFKALLSGSFLSAIGGMLLAPILFIILALVGRIYAELVIVIFRIAENTGRLADQSKSNQ